MERKRLPPEVKGESKEVKEESSKAFEAVWSKGLEDWFQAFLDGSPLAINQISLWVQANKGKEIASAWCEKLAKQKEISGSTFSIEQEVLLGLILFYWMKDTEKALISLERAAKENNSTAQFSLSYIYRESDQVQSLLYLESAATNSKPSAQAITMIGKNYFHGGQGFSMNLMLAQVRYVQAAALGDPSAAYKMGLLFLNSPGDVNNKEALHFFRQAAAAGDWEALIQIANMYRQGRGVPQDQKEAERLYDLAAEISPKCFHLAPVREFYSRPLQRFFDAAESGDPLKIADLLQRLGVKNEADKKIAQEQLLILEKEKASLGDEFLESKQVLLGFIYYGIKDYEKARFCFSSIKKSNINAQIGLTFIRIVFDHDKTGVFQCYTDIIKDSPHPNPLALLELGEICHQNKNYPSALHYFTQANLSGLSGAALSLGEMHYFGQGVNADKEMAVQYWQEATVKGNIKALAQLGGAHSLGVGLEQKYAEALRVLRFAAELGSASAQNRLGTMFYRGYGIPRDSREASRLFNLAIESGMEQVIISALNNLGNLYTGHYPEDKNLELAASYYRRAIEKGSEQGKEEFTQLFLKNPNDPSVIYHAAMAIGNANMREAFNKLAVTNPAIFDELADHDPWEKIKALLSEENAKLVYARKFNTFSQIQQVILGSTTLTTDPATVVSSFFTHESYLPIFQETGGIEEEIKQVLSGSTEGDPEQRLCVRLQRLRDSKSVPTEAIETLFKKHQVLVQKEKKSPLSSPEQMLLGMFCHFQGPDHFKKAVDYLTAAIRPDDKRAVKLLEMIYQYEINRLILLANPNDPITHKLLYQRLQALQKINPDLCIKIIKLKDKQIIAKEEKEISVKEQAVSTILNTIFKYVLLKQKAPKKTSRRATIELHVKLSEFVKSPAGKTLVADWCAELENQKSLTSGEKILLGILNDVQGTSAGYTKARKLFVEMADHQNDFCAWHFLGMIYEKGHGVTADPSQAEFFYQKAKAALAPPPAKEQPLLQTPGKAEPPNPQAASLLSWLNPFGKATPKPPVQPTEKKLKS